MDWIGMEWNCPISGKIILDNNGSMDLWTSEKNKQKTNKQLNQFANQLLNKDCVSVVRRDSAMWLILCPWISLIQNLASNSRLNVFRFNACWDSHSWWVLFISIAPRAKVSCFLLMTVFSVNLDKGTTT